MVPRRSAATLCRSCRVLLLGSDTTGAITHWISLRTWRAILPLLIAVVLSSACSAPSDPQPADPCAGARAGGSIRAVFLVEQDRAAPSIARNFSVSSLQPLIPALQCRGGVISVGPLRSYSDRPLVRLRLEPPPLPPVVPTPAGDYVQRTAALTRARDELASYDRTVSQWRKTVDQRVAAFDAALQSLLAQSPSVQLDVWHALQRAALFGCEPGAGQKARLVVISTAQDSVSGAQPPLIRWQCLNGIAVVNPQGLKGILGDRGVAQFDALSPALRWVLREAKS